MHVSGGFRSQTGLIVSAWLLTWYGGEAYAAGFAVRAQSATSIGTAGASDFAGTTDVSAMFSNPATLSAFRGMNISLGGSYVMPSAEFSNGERTVANTGVPAVNDAPNTKESDDFTEFSFIPALYGSYQINDDIVTGVSVTVPFGTYTNYEKDWVGRYHGTKTELQVINLDLAASYRILPELKVGFGIQVQQAKGVIEGASNYGVAAYGGSAQLVGQYYAAVAAGDSAAATQALQAINANPIATSMKNSVDSAIQGQAPTAIPGIVSNVLNTAVVSNEGKDDIFAQYTGQDVSYGVTLGVLYTPIPELDLGLSYRSSVMQNTSGDYELSTNSDLARNYVNSIGAKHDADLDIATPDVYGLGAVYKGIVNTQLYASAAFTRWSRLRDINVRPDGTNNVLVKLDWEDVWHVGIGGAYKLNNWTIRGGVASDDSPTPDDLRSPRSPDDDRILFSVGGRYEDEGWSVDLGFMHAVFKDPTLNLHANAYPEANGRGNLKGDYAVSSNTLTAQYNMNL